MSKHETLQTQQLRESLFNFHDVFEKDFTLLTSLAAKHRLAITQGDILTPPVLGAYNFRNPLGSINEIAAIFRAKTIAITCPDWRQSWDVYDYLNQPDIYIAVAAGIAQLTERRANTVVNLLSVIHQINPDAQIIGVAHDGVCAGVDKFTNQSLSKLKNEYFGDDSVRAEHDFLLPFLTEIHRKLQEKSVPAQFAIARIGDANNFMGMLPILAQPEGLAVQYS